MTETLTDLPGSGSFARGLHPPGRKEFAQHQAIEVLPAPAQVTIPLLQHTGAPCEALVKNRQEVAAGEMIGKSDAFISAPVHTPIAGVCGMASVTTLPNGRHVKTVPVKAGQAGQLSPEALREDVLGGDWPTDGLDAQDPKSIAEKVLAAGIVGLGGAAFPTHVKLMRNEAKPIDTLLVNGCECEPYLTADHRLMVEAPAPIVTGALLAAHAAGAERAIIAIEDNKPDAAQKMREAAEGTAVKVVVVKTRYPMGGEKMTLLAVLKRKVPTGGLPLDVGVVVINVGTAAAIARAVLRGKPLTHRIVSVTGAGVREPKNLLAPIGVTYGELIDFCGGMTEDAARVVAGGPMMGFAMHNLNVPITKGTSGVVVLTDGEVPQSEETTCVRCGRCVDVCPLDLVPTKIALSARQKDWDLAKRYHMAACWECGCCAYVCPAHLPLVQLIRMGKAQAPRD